MKRVADGESASRRSAREGRAADRTGGIEPRPVSPTRGRQDTVLDAVLDVGFFLLLIVSGLRYFAFHPWLGEGLVVLALAVGVGLAYALSLVGRWRSPGRGTGSRAVLLSATLWMPLAVLAPSFGWCAVALILRLRPVLRSRLAWAFPVLMLLAEAVGLVLMTGAADLGLVLGALFAGFVLTWAVAALDASLRRRSLLIDELRAARVRLAEAERRAGASAERERMSGELHDTVVQRSAGALMLLETTILTDPQVSERTLEARDGLREALRQARALLHEAPEGDGAAAGSLAERLGTEAAAAGTTFEVAGVARPLPSASELALVRAAQEGLSNAIRHAGGPLETLVLRFGVREASVEVSDQGLGFDPEGLAQDSRGFGLRAMRSRLGAVGGVLRVRSSPGEGTSLIASVPAPPVGGETGRERGGA